MHAYSRLVDVMQTYGLIKKTKILVAGLQGSGKTRLLLNIAQMDKLRGTLVTMSRGSMCVEKLNLSFHTLDLGGPGRDDQLRKELIRGAAAVIFVVDVMDEPSYDLAAGELAALGASPELDGVPFMILANKCDIEDKAGA